jgi:protein-disulfide isomerase
VAVIIAGLVVAGAIYFRANAPQAVAPTATKPPAPEPTITIPVDEADPVLGDANAPVTIVEFSDFECPFCRQFHQTTFPQLQREYIDTGRVKFVFKDFPLSQIHPRAQAAAEAAQCAHQQDKFWEYSAKLFAPESTLEEPKLLTLASELGLNAATFTTCLKAHEQAEKVTKNTQAAIAAGISSTPSFVVNGTLVEGALPFAAFQEVIEAKLSQ